jgi:hypothetical protein
MKKIILKTAAILLLTSGVVIACKKEKTINELGCDSPDELFSCYEIQ